MWFRSPLVLLALWVLVSAAPHCDWEQPGDPGLPDNCRAACCSDPDCDLVLVRNGTDVCETVKCGSRDRSQEPDPEREECVSRHREQGAVYRRKPQRKVESEAEEGGERARDEPLDPESPNIRCRLPVKVGHCRASLPRFFYNVTSSSCRSFIYGGCSANGNNFKTRDKCEDTCRGVTGNRDRDTCRGVPPHQSQSPTLATCYTQLQSGPTVTVEITINQLRTD
ncbi:BPTI/Kunitz domain-containing protein 4-like [Plectropomus leopardus]|uniref:BPTI/Kunitz domain-containing protein 4-like n=1 Tax=Plectropomus leopardus TaxID=160734 RepID=UPI001C4D5FB7|nr:BPTI/Kunitz domain-containing protein 4-like [Plectropomus leopardus]